MSETLNTTQPVDQLPILPETQPIDHIIQCGVLYLGTAPLSAGLRGLDSIQEPFSHRYPVDGTNTVRGIDAVLSVYDNGLQLAFTRQPYSVIFFPISSLIYCASLRFSIIKNDQTKPSSPIDWRFMPLDTIPNDENKHPPLFCAAVQRTQIIPGEECHCFITKSVNTAIALVQTISQIYENIRPGIKCLKSPIFYQLDRYGRKLSEITGVIYISPANDDDSQLNRTNGNQIIDENLTRHYLFDPLYDGFFYRTDASIIEQWQLWDDDDNLNNSRPHPPASPFGLHEGLYHDDTTHEIQQYLRHMDDENPSYSCSSSISNQSSCTTTTTTSSISTGKKHRYRSNKPKTTKDTDEFNLSLSKLHKSSFEPKKNRKPIIIEKILPKSISSIPILHPRSLKSSKPIQDSYIDTNQQPFDLSSLSCQINEHGEKITKEGNRIIFMDTIQLNPNPQPIDSSSSYKSVTSHRRHKHRHQTSKQIPVIDMRSIERLFNEKNSKNINIDNQSKTNNHLTTPQQFEVVNRYFDDYQENKSKSNNPTNESIFDPLESIDRKNQQQQQKTSIISSTHSSKNENHHHRHRRSNHSTITTGPAINYVEHSFIPSLTKNQITSLIRKNSPISPILTDEKLNEYISNIYGTTRSVKSTSSSLTTQQENKSLDKTAVVNATYISAFRYMQSSMNRNMFEEFRNAY